MSEELNKLLIKVYNRYKNYTPEKSPVPIKTIQEYLILEGYNLEEVDKGVV